MLGPKTKLNLVRQKTACDDIQEGTRICSDPVIEAIIKGLNLPVTVMMDFIIIYSMIERQAWIAHRTY